MNSLNTQSNHGIRELSVEEINLVSGGGEKLDKAKKVLKKAWKKTLVGRIAAAGIAIYEEIRERRNEKKDDCD